MVFLDAEHLQVQSFAKQRWFVRAMGKQMHNEAGDGKCIEGADGSSLRRQVEHGRETRSWQEIGSFTNITF